jgi:hypothetical protein
MSYTAVLCHFCEKDGPAVLLTTHHEPNIRSPDETDEKLVLQNLNSLPDVEVVLTAVKSSCEYCHSLTPQAPFIVSWPSHEPDDGSVVHEEAAKLTFLSSRLPPGKTNFIPEEDSKFLLLNTLSLIYFSTVISFKNVIFLEQHIFDH